MGLFRKQRKLTDCKIKVSQIHVLRPIVMNNSFEVYLLNEVPKCDRYRLVSQDNRDPIAIACTRSK